MARKVLIVEDQFIEANNLQMILVRAGYEVLGIARAVPIALEMIAEQKPDLVLLDILLRGPLTGIDLAKTLRQQDIAFVYLSANSDSETLAAAKATRPYGFLVKPFREKDVLVMLEISHYSHENNLDSVVRKSESRGVIATVSKSSSSQDPHNFRGILGKSEKLQTVLRHLELVAPSDTSVIILGENGTGKERLAECVHELSGRRSRPLVKINCAALPSNLVESILFGHERGAFTGASERRIGKFEQAHGGTIFLDEIGELDIEVQVKLLRVLQEREIERVGGSQIIPVDVRVIAATNRNLEKAVADGKFRMDLYYRLNVFPLTLPPLRDRKEDIPLLARHFADLFSNKIGKQLEPIPNEIMNELTAHSWPGNVRELSHTLERAVLLAQKNRITHVSITHLDKQESTSIKTLEQHERDHIIIALRQCHGKIFGEGGAAELLGLHPSTLNSRIKKLGIEKDTTYKTFR